MTSRRILAAAALLAACFALLPKAQAQDAPALSARCAVLVDGESGRVLFGRREAEERPMASITKVMTALLALERCSLADVVTILPEDLETEGSALHLRAGEQITLKALLYGLLLESGNDAALAIARHCGGTVESFVAQMNGRALALGLRHTQFANPSGLPEAGHYSSAADMAAITRAALNNQAFAPIFAAKTFAGEGHSFRNHNKLLWQYDGAAGGKTGFTKEAGRTLITCARRNGRLLIAVTLHGPDDWSDHTKLLDYGFAAYEQMPLCDPSGVVTELLVQNGESESVALCPKEGVAYPLGEGETLNTRISLLPGCETAPLERGETAGVLTWFLGGVPVAQTELVYETSVPVNNQTLLERFLRLFG